ncbi:unnamed protein product [Tilletia controversa]|uniref:Uncharacterized protein n=2 Tax=Tilletia TaxID=13289 RepID=A0A177VGQ5_9BASI|nr:hypothetical protein CF336_g3515 [Tilletia laevis]KAE8199512.1 hypothetical protein CF328_g3225 [Tilletia controversa]KAE8240755.1 hypothetical protein A4X03_0g8392 [Tilletia caries]KAE8204204.1 hypothetical protein CF335_g2738 [Tilletia laevis]CAD6884852.1 unnamed protein product [Tilletia caries]
MVHLRTLTIIFLSSLVAFTTADLLEYSRKVQIGFNQIRDMLNEQDDPDFDGLQGTVTDVVDSIKNNAWRLNISTKYAVEVIPQGKALDEIWKVLQETYRPGGNADKVCKKLPVFAKRLEVEKDKGVMSRKRIADAFDKLIQNHGELMYATTKFNDSRFPEVMHQANKPLLAAYFSIAH